MFQYPPRPWAYGCRCSSGSTNPSKPTPIPKQPTWGGVYPYPYPLPSGSGRPAVGDSALSTFWPPMGQHCPGWIEDGDPIVWAENEATRSFLILRIFLKHQNGLEVGSRSRNLRFYEKNSTFWKSRCFWFFCSMKYDGNRWDLWFLVVRSDENIKKNIKVWWKIKFLCFLIV